MYEAFTVEHLRGLDRVELTELSPVNLISGRNNSGKSALLEALFLHTSGPHAAEFALRLLTPIRTGAPVTIDPTGQADPWASFFLRQDLEIPIRLIGKWDRGTTAVELTKPASSRPHGVLPYAQPGQASATYSITVSVRQDDEPPASYSQDVSAQAIAPPTQLFGNVSLQFSGLNFKLDPPAETLAPAFISTARSRTPQQELARRYSNLKMLGRERDFLAAMRVIEPRLRHVEVLINNGQPSLHADIGVGTLLPLQLLGEGSVILADLITSIFEVRNGYALIDEIENGVHYSILPDLWHHLGRAARQAKVQIFATTHSRECVVAAHATFRETPNFLSLIRLARLEGSPVTNSVTRYDSGTLEAALDLDLDVR